MTVQIFDIGNTVLCDMCNGDFTESDAQGGFLFGSYAVCPNCAPRVRASAKKYGEEKFITAEAAPGETFRDFTLRQRGGDNTVTIRSGDDFDPFTR